MPFLKLYGSLFHSKVIVKMDWDGIIKGNKVMRFLRRLALTFSSMFCNFMIIESYEALRNALKSCPSLAHKLKVVYNGYFDELLKPIPHTKREPIVLTVARVTPVKGHHDLISSFAKVANKYSSWRLRIIGPVTNEAYFRGLIRLVNDLDLESKVEFVGFVSDAELVREYSRASIFVLPSYEEGSSIARVEALAFGLPVITTDTGGSEVCRGVGIIIKPGDVEALANALDQLMGNNELREKLSRRSIKRAKQLTWKNTCRVLINLSRAPS
jgi:glycosyltransferase involved in cell wall biosynthesis